MRFGRRQPAGEAIPHHERLWKPSEGLSVVDGDTRDALEAEFNAVTGRDTDPMRDYYDGVFWIGNTRVELIRPADARTDLAYDRYGVLQIDAMDPSAPPTVRNMRFRIVSRTLAELGKEDSAYLIDGEFGGWPLPGRAFDPKPILPDAVAYALDAIEERRWQDQLELALAEEGRPVRPRYHARLAV